MHAVPNKISWGLARSYAGTKNSKTEVGPVQLHAVPYYSAGVKCLPGRISTTVVRKKASQPLLSELNNLNHQLCFLRTPCIASTRKYFTVLCKLEAGNRTCHTSAQRRTATFNCCGVCWRVNATTSTCYSHALSELLHHIAGYERHKSAHCGDV